MENQKAIFNIHCPSLNGNIPQIQNEPVIERASPTAELANLSQAQREVREKG